MAKLGKDRWTRRQALAVGLSGAAALSSSLAGAAPSPKKGKRMSANRMPVAFLPHGGGPWPFVQMGIGRPEELTALAAYLRSVKDVPKQKPKALLVVSAHWEERVPTVMTAPKPPMFYDYYGFPPESYQITWPAPGEPRLAAKVRSLLESAGFQTAEDATRGFDHGTFVPLKLTYPEAEIPTIQLSLIAGLDPARHLQLGRALQPLRDEGVFIVGSGMTYHNLRAFGPAAAPVATAFDDWLKNAATQPSEERDRALTAWAQAPSARRAHPREEHLLPLMVIAGAAGADRGALAFEGSILDLAISAYHFG